MESITVFPMMECYKIDTMIYINFNNLDDETQQRLLSISKKDVESRYGNDLKTYAQEQHLDYQNVLDVEAIRNLYNYKYVFNI